jgi:hypothetical protein
MPPFPGFIFGSNPSQSLIADNEQTMNLYVEPIDSAGASTKAALYPTPGFVPRITVPDVGARALFDMAARTFGVVGGVYYEFFPLQGGFAARGTVQEDARLAQIVSNGPAGQLLVSSGGHAYLHVLASNVVTLVLAGEATQIGMLDTFFLAFNAASGRLRISASNDGATWAPTQFVARSQQPDPWRAMIVNAPDIWLFGEQTSDIWYDSGATPFPFVPRTGLSIPYGIAAPFSVAASGGNLFWLAKNRDGAGLVVLAAGYAPVPISTPELNTTIAEYARTSSITDAEGLIYQDAGHVFYVLRFPSAGATWVYDLTTKLWAERGKWIPAANRYEVWAPRVRCYSNGLQLTGDATGVISAMDVTFGTETDGTAIRRLRRAPVLVNEQKRISLGRFELLMEVGLGVAVGQGVDPQVMFRASADGGQTWGNERQASAGRMGEYRRRVFWTRLGSPRLWVPEITMTDPIAWRIMGASLNNEAAA